MAIDDISIITASFGDQLGNTGVKEPATRLPDPIVRFDPRKA